MDSNGAVLLDKARRNESSGTANVWQRGSDQSVGERRIVDMGINGVKFYIVGERRCTLFRKDWRQIRSMKIAFRAVVARKTAEGYVEAHGSLGVC